MAEVETALGRLRIEQVDADQRAAAIREQAHAGELTINRRQQQLEFNRHQTESLAARAADVHEEIRDLDARRDPARIALESRRQAMGDAESARDDAEAVRVEAANALAQAQQQIEGLEGNVESARTEVYSALNSVTTLRHAAQHAAAQHERVGEMLAKLQVEEDDVRREGAKVDADQAAATESMGRTRQTLDSLHLARLARESELSAARSEYEGRARDIRSREQDLAAADARLASLGELASSRAEFGDAARMVLVHANGHVGQQGAVADYVEVDSRYERAVEACLGDLLQHVIVERHDQAAAGLSLVREQDAGRCGFVVIDPGSNGYYARQGLQHARHRGRL